MQKFHPFPRVSDFHMLFWSPKAKEEEMDAKFLKDKKFWFASFLVAWAAALQAHMSWLQKQDAFKEKFGDLNQKKDG